MKYKSNFTGLSPISRYPVGTIFRLKNGATVVSRGLNALFPTEVECKFTSGADDGLLGSWFFDGSKKFPYMWTAGSDIVSVVSIPCTT